MLSFAMTRPTAGSERLSFIIHFTSRRSRRSYSLTCELQRHAQHEPVPQRDFDARLKELRQSIDACGLMP